MRILLIVFLSLFIIACNPQVVRIHQPVVCTNFQKPDPIQPLEVQLHPVQDEDKVWWVGVDTNNYRNIAINNSAMLEYIVQSKAVISYLETCIERHNRGVSNSE